MKERTEEADSVDTLSGGLTVPGLLQRLWPYFAGDRLACLSVCIIVVLHAVVGRSIVVIFGLAVDRGILGKNVEFLLWMAAAYFGLELVMMALQTTISMWFSRIGNRVLDRLRDHLVRHVQSLPIRYFDRVSSGRIVTRLTADTVSFTELFNQGLLSVFSSVISIITIVIAMSLISLKMAALTLLVAPPMTWMAFRLSDKILIAQRESKRFVSAINSFVAESVSGIRVIQLFNQIASQRQRFDKLSGEYRTANLKVVGLYALFHPTVSLFTAVSVATALYVGGDLAFSGIVTTGAMVSFIFHVKDFGDPLRNILEKYQLFQNSISSGERVFALLGETEETDSTTVTQLPATFSGDIEFSSVSFRYQDHLPLALDDVSFKIPNGKTLAVVGRTGSGKSTIISLLQRFRDPTSGEIRIDGRALPSLSRSAVRRRVGVVQQDVFLFRGTISENIGLGDPEISGDRIAWAAQEAGLSRLLKMRPGGLAATVEERGANLSLGERQLVAFARILAFDPQILVLDEATANVDSETERLLQEAALRARQNRTSILIAHRLSTIADADLVMVLELGKIVEFDSPERLLKRDSHYRKMVESHGRAGSTLDERQANDKPRS